MSHVLHGYTVGVTASRRSEEQLALLMGRGATCLHGPTTEVSWFVEADVMLDVTKRLIDDPPDLVVALSGIGLRGWFEGMEVLSMSNDLYRLLAASRIVARGPEAAGALSAAGLSAERLAVSTTDRLFHHIVDAMPGGSRIAVQNDGAPGQPFVDRLNEAGFNAVGVPIYRCTVPADRGPAEVLVRAVVDGRADAVTFTSVASVRHLVEVARGLAVDERLASAFRNSVVPVCVDPATSAEASALNFGTPIEPTRHRLGAMVQQLTDLLAARRHRFVLAGLEVERRGRLLRVAGASPTMLSARERAVLSVLLERPGVVWSKGQLLDAVWGSRDSGNHVVEVTVGRLRRRLGPAGVAIETVLRRGYRVNVG